MACFLAAHHPRHDQRAGPGQRRDDREERGGMKRAGARPQDDQHADQADRGRKPAAHADALAKKDDRQRGDEQRRDEAGGGRFRDRKKPQAGDEEQRRRQQRDAAHHLQPEPSGSQRVERRARQHRRRHDQREHQKPDPGDLDRGQRRRQIFRGDVGGAEKNRRGQDQRDAAERPIGARRRAVARRTSSRAKAMRALSSLAAAAGGGVTVKLGRGNIRIGRAPKKRQLAGHDKVRKQEADMRDCARQRRACPPLKHFVNNVRVAAYSIGRLRGFGPRGNAVSSAAISSLASARVRRPRRSRRHAPASRPLESQTPKGSRVRNASATWRGDAPCASAILCSTSPALLRGSGKSL